MEPKNAMDSGEAIQMRQDQTDEKKIDEMLRSVVADQDNLAAQAEILGPRHVRIILGKVDPEEIEKLGNNRVVVRNMRTDQI